MHYIAHVCSDCVLIIRIDFATITEHCGHRDGSEQSPYRTPCTVPLPRAARSAARGAARRADGGARGAVNNAVGENMHARERRGESPRPPIKCHLVGLQGPSEAVDEQRGCQGVQVHAWEAT